MSRDFQSPLSAWRRLGFMLLSFGFDPRKFRRACRTFPEFFKNFINFRRGAGFRERLFLSPIFGESIEAAGSITDDYFALDLWAAKKTFQVRPQRHLDVGSRLDGFVAHVLTWSAIDVLDVRPLTSGVPGLNFVQDDARTCDLIESDSYDLVTSLHAIEHFGLGRYGDQIDPDGVTKAIKSLVRIVKPGGYLILGFPTGKNEVLFNAQRLLDPVTVMESIPGDVVEIVTTNHKGWVNEVSDLRSVEYSCVGMLVRITK